MFGVCLQADHKLIQSGTYSIVRHPGYAVWIVLTIGVIILHIGTFPTPYAQTTPLLWTLEKWYTLLYISLWVVGSYPLIMRANVEDAMLRECCGQKWIDYAGELPYQFIVLLWYIQWYLTSHSAHMRKIKERLQSNLVKQEKGSGY